MGKREAAYDHWVYYREHHKERLDYFRDHHAQWSKMKKFARATDLTLVDARNYIDRKLKGWYLEVGLLPKLPRQRYRQRRKIKVWRDVVTVHRSGQADKEG